MHQDVPVKPRRNKKLDVPIHRHDKTEEVKFNPNVSGRRSKHTYEHTKSQYHGQGDISTELSENINKISRRVLTKENERLTNENVELLNIQEHLNKKNCKLKEKLTAFVTANEELSNENNLIKTQYQQLVNQYNEYIIELEKPKICQNCVDLGENLDMTKRHYAALKKMHHEQTEDCNMLKNVVYRLNVQLERYQQKLNSNNIHIKDINIKSKHSDDNIETVSAEQLGLGENHYDHTHTPIAWGKVNSHTLGPLLNAYQEAINEKVQIIENYEAEMSKFTGRLKDISKENEGLHARLTEDNECSKVLNVQLLNVKAELKTTKEQNDLLIKKCALKQDKIEEILKCYEQKVEQLKRDYTVLHEQYCKSRSDLTALKEKNKSLAEAQDDFKNERQQYIPISVHTSSVNECKKWYEELKQQYANEKIKLTETMDQLKVQITDLNKKIITLTNEKLELDGKIKTADKYIKKAESKYLELEHNLHEVQLSRSACRKQLHKAMSFAKDLVGEQESLLKALNQRQQENKAVKKIGTDIASRMDLLRNELKTVQREAWQELSTVEERIQEQDITITTMKEEHESEVERLKQIIRATEGNLLLTDNASIPVNIIYRNKNVHS